MIRKKKMSVYVDLPTGRRETERLRIDFEQLGETVSSNH